MALMLALQRLRVHSYYILIRSISKSRESPVSLLPFSLSSFSRILSVIYFVISYVEGALLLREASEY